MKIKKIAIVPLGMNILSCAMGYTLLHDEDVIKYVFLNNSHQGQEKTTKENEEHQAFVKEYKKQFGQIWNDVEGNKKRYEDAQKKPYENMVVLNKTLNQFVLMRMHDAYKDLLKRFYPHNALFKIEEQIQKGHHNYSGPTLQKQAEEAVENYLNNDTCTGCCWLLCFK